MKDMGVDLVIVLDIIGEFTMEPIACFTERQFERVAENFFDTPNLFLIIAKTRHGFILQS